MEAQDQVKSSIGKICRLTKDNQQCFTSLESDPNIDSGDAKGLAFGSIEAASSNITDISHHLKLLVSNMTFSPQLQQGLVDCRGQLIDVADDLDDCLEAFMEHELGDVQNWLKAAIDAAARGSGEDPLVEKTQVFKGLCENAPTINAAYASDNSTLLA